MEAPLSLASASACLSASWAVALPSRGTRSFLYLVGSCLVALGGVLGSIVRGDGVDPVSGKLCINRGGGLTPAHMIPAAVASVGGGALRSVG